MIDFVQPDVLRKKFDFTIRDEPESNQRILDLTKQTIDMSVKPGESLETFCPGLSLHKILVLVTICQFFI